jgi:inosose dehydratase
MSTSSVTLDPENVWIGVISSIWSNDDFPLIDIGIPFGQMVSEIALAGYQGSGVGHKYPTDVDELQKALALRGLRISEPWTNTYFTITDMEKITLQRFRKALDFMQQMSGTDMVVSEFGQAVNPLPVAVFPDHPIFDDRQWDALTRGLEHLGGIANSEGMRLCYHPHMGTGVMTRADIDRLMSSTDPNLVHLLLDTAHIAFAGDDPLAVAQDYGDRIKHVHLKSVRADVVDKVRAENLSFQDAIEAGVFTVPGDGAIDFVPILQALADHGFEGWLVVEAEQDPAKANPLEYALMAREYLRGILGW